MNAFCYLLLPAAYRRPLNSSLSSFLSAPLHLRAADIAFFVDEIKMSLLFLYTAIVYHLPAAAFFLAASHFGLVGAAIFADEIKEPLFSFDATFTKHLTHLIHPPSINPDCALGSGEEC